MKPSVYLVDGSLYVFRAWHAMPPDFTDKDGRPVSAVHGFVRFLLDVIEQTQATHMLVAFDHALENSFRNDIYPPYKANRTLPPPDLDYQFQKCQEVCQALGLVNACHDRYEADDLIGSAAHRSHAQGMRTIIISADKDFGQLLQDDDEQWDFARHKRWRRAGVFDKLGVYPHQVADYLALCGDSIDNIPGIPGIGSKSAAYLLQHFDSLETLLTRIDEVPFLRLRGAKRIAQNLQQHSTDARLFKRLTQIAIDAPVSSDLKRQPQNQAALEMLADTLRLGPLTRGRIKKLS